MNILAALLLICLALGAAALVRTLMIPVRKSDYKPSADDPRALSYAQKLSRMVQYDTTSYADTDQRETFLGYHKILEELFPLVHRHLAKTEIAGSLLYHWKGKDDKYPVVLMGHQDVVPVSGEWSKPPFSGKSRRERSGGAVRWTRSVPAWLSSRQWRSFWRKAMCRSRTSGCPLPARRSGAARAVPRWSTSCAGGA